MSSTPETAAAAETAETTTTTTAPAAPAPVPAETTSGGCDYDPLDDLDLPPLRIRATRHGDRLSASSLNIPPGIQASAQKRYSLDSKAPQLATAAASPTGVGSLASSIASVRRGRSRSRSPSLRAKEQRSLADGNSSLSSLEEFVDPDILYDKMGFVELEGTSKGHSSFGDNQNTRAINLTPVSERMSEDTLEDVHAFSDLSANTNTRPSSSVGTGGSTVGGEVSSHILEPLDEGDEELESDDEHHVDADHEHRQKPSQVILTNLEKITLDEAAEDELEEEDDEEGKA